MDTNDLRARLPSSRRKAKNTLDRLVRDNRFTISASSPLNGAVPLTTSAMDWLPDPLVFNALLILLGTPVMHSPPIVGVLPLVTRRVVLGAGVLTAYAYAVEHIGVTTGWPYGWFHYGVDLGSAVTGVPVGLPVFFILLVVNTYLLCLLLLGDRAHDGAVRLGVVATAVLAMDVMPDPGAVALDFWKYYRLGGDVLLFYGIPPSSYVSWVVNTTVVVITFGRLFDCEVLLVCPGRTESMLGNLVNSVTLWGGTNVRFGNWTPVAVATLFGVGPLKADRLGSRLLRLPRWLLWHS